MSFASNKNAFGISDRSGFRYRLRDMKKEWTGALVGPDEFEPKHPQLYPPRVGPDPQALRNPRPPSPETLKAFVGIPLVDDPKLERPRLVGQVGQVTVTDSDSGNVDVTLTGVAGTAGVGSVSVDQSVANITGVAGTSGVGSVTVNVTSATTYTVTVASYLGANVYYLDGTRQPTLNLSEGSTYIFDWSAATGHPLRFSTTSNGTHGGGSEYTTGVTIDTGNYKSTITVAVGAPTLYYYCQYHSNMGGQINTS